MEPAEKQVIDELVRGLVDLFLPAGADLSARMADDWRTTFERPGLGFRERILVGVAAAAALGQLRLLELHVRAATYSRAATDHAALSEVLFFMVPYCGWAPVLNALASVPADGTPAGALESLDRKALRELGHAKAREVNPQFEKVAAKIAARDPGLLDHLTETAYGAVYGRPGLDLKTRELLAVALLTVSGQEPQLKYHLRGALNTGASAEEIREVLLQMHLYAGWPTALAGLTAFDAISGGGQ